MTAELNRVEALPVRKPGAPTKEPHGFAAPGVRLTCPSCSAELTSMVDHAVAPVGAGSATPVRWTAEAGVVAATLKALLASVVVAPGVEAPAVVAPGVEAPGVEAPAPVEVTSSSPKTPHLRLLPPAPEGPPAVDAVTTDDAEAEAPNRPQAVSTRRRRHGFFSRVLTMRTFRVERDVARGARDQDAAVTALLDGAATKGVVSLHHHRLPGRRAEVAHVAVGASGIFVIDARHLKEASRDLTGEAAGAPGADGLEDRRMTDAIATVGAQVAALRSTLAAVELDDVRVQGLLCLGGKDLLVAGADDEASEVRVVSLDDLTSLVTVTGLLTNDHRVTLIEFLRTQMTSSP